MEIRIEESFRDGTFAEIAYTFAPVGLVVTENRVIRDCNLAFAQMFGYQREELRDQMFSMLYPSDEEFVNIRDRGVKQLRETNTYWDERIMARKDGKLFWCRVRGHSFTPETPLQRAVWSFADISEDRPLAEMSLRERQVAKMLAEGNTTKEIARLLGLSPRTVEVHRARLMKKFSARNSLELIAHIAGIPL